MDGDFSRNERDTMLVILRKTLHFNKWNDRLAIHWLAKAVGVGQATIRKVLEQLEAKGLICVERSKGGRMNSTKKYNSFGLDTELITLVFHDWIKIKEEAGFML